MRAKRNNAGFSLTELLMVVGIIGAVAAMLGGGSWHIQISMQVRNHAAEFLQTVKTARQYAVNHRCRVRVAFREGLWSEDAIVAADESLRTYRIHAFIVPSSAPGGSGRWVEIPGANTEALTEWAHLELAPRSESLVGRWLVCPLDPHSRRVPDSVKITSPLFERFLKDEADKFFAENYYTPEATWTRDIADPHEPENCFSVFPADYRKTPTDLGPVLFTGELPEDEQCFDPVAGELAAAHELWPGEVRFIRGVEEKKLCELPGIEFQPDGSLACVWTRELEVSFSRFNNAHAACTVLIDAATGLARIEQPRVE